MVGLGLQCLDVLGILLELWALLVQGCGQCSHEGGRLLVRVAAACDQYVANQVAVLVDMPRVAELFGLGPGTVHCTVLPTQ